MKKLLIFASAMFLMLPQVFADSRNDGRSSEPMTLKGDWDLVRHECSSGARPADNFLPSRDRVQVIFREQSFSSRADQAGCSTWSDGQYWLQENRLLTLQLDQVQSNCSVPPRRSVRTTYAMDFLAHDEFVLYLGPVDGGICPAGDLLINTYHRF